MPEYVGYKGGSTQVDFAGEARKIAEQVQDIDERRTLEKEELDAMNTLDMDAYQYGNSQTTDAFVHSGASIIRDKQVQWNKQLKAGLITKKDYKARNNNVKSYWGSLAETAQGYGDRLMQHVERDQAGQSSIHENFMSGVYADLQNLEQKTVHIDEQTGALLLYNTDENGRLAGEPIDIHHLNNPNNVIDAKVNVPESVGETVKNWSSFEEFKDLGRGATSKETDVRLNKMYEQSLAELQYTMMYNKPNAIVSIIGDNGVLGTFESADGEHNISVSEFLIGTDGNLDNKEAAKQKQLDILKKKLKNSKQTALTPEEEQGFLNEVDKYMMGVTRDTNGTFVTHPTEFHEELASERIRHEVEINLGHEEQGTTKRKPTTSGGSGNGDDSDKYRNGYDATVKALDGDFSGLNSDYIYKRHALGIRVYKREKVEGKDVTEENIAYGREPFITAKSMKDLAIYAYGGSQDSARQKWDSVHKKYGNTSSSDGDAFDAEKFYKENK